MEGINATPKEGSYLRLGNNRICREIGFWSNLILASRWDARNDSEGESGTDN